MVNLKENTERKKADINDWKVNPILNKQIS